MKINIKATGIELTPAIADYVEKKISSTEKYLPLEASVEHLGVVAQVEVGMSTHHHKAGNIFRAEVHLTGEGLDLYAAAEKDDLYAAIDVVKDEVIREATQSKGKRLVLARRGAEMMKNFIKGITNSFKRRP